MTTIDKHAAQLVPIDSLKEFPGNPRIGDIKVIRESLRRNGQYRPVVVRRKTKEILAGNHTWKAAKEEGYTEIWATFIDCDIQTAKRINSVDNRSSDLGGWDQEALVAQLASLPDLGGTGWTGADYDRMASQLAVGSGTDSEPGQPPQDPKTQMGDLWLLGDHRLVCGDATDPDAVAYLIEDEAIDCLYADPPFGTGGANLMANNARAGAQDMISASFELANRYLRDGAVVYASHLGDTYSVVVGRCFVEQGWKIKHTLIWVKDAAAESGDGYHMQNEFILYGHTGKSSAVSWYGDDRQSTVLKFARTSSTNKLSHPTVRPIELLEQLLINSTKKGDLVYDPFSGSGSVLIAAENLKRPCCAMEVDPKYCDVIVDRWERHVGQEAQLIRAGSK